MRPSTRTMQYHMFNVHFVIRMSFHSVSGRSNLMEVTYQKQEDEDEVIGEDLQTRRKSTPHHQKKSYSCSSSSESILTSESSDEYSPVSMNTTTSSNNNITTTNGEYTKIIEGRSESQLALEDLSQADDKAEFEEIKTRDNYINVSQNQESNGLKNVESLLDESPNSINVTLSETYYVENIVNKTLTVKGQNEIVETGPSQEIEPGLEFDVEKVIQKQTTHDLYCPNCNSCITKRVILKRRKRKFEGISTNEGLEPDSTVPGEKDTENKNSENERNKDTEDPGARFGAVSCFSCFSIFIPKGDGFLWWRFKPKTDVSPQQDGTSLEYKDPISSPRDDGRGKSFPLWILTCCQPSHIEKPVLKPGSKTPTISRDVTDKLFNDNEVSSTPSHDGSVPSKSQPSTIADPGNQLPDLQLTPKSPGTANNHDFPLWFLSCCQPSSDRVKQEQSPKPDTKLPPGSQPPVTDDEDVGTLGQDASKPPVASEEDVGTLVPPVPKPSVPSEIEDTVPPHLKPQPIPGDEDKVPPPHLKPQPTPEDGPPLHKPSPLTEPKADIPSSTEPEPSNSAIKEDVAVQINEEPLIQATRTGVSGLDIIKAIVYGGLVECITSLSVISSAAGGDATTLNIVALGLANVFGGLVVLLHNVRVLKHEHSEDRYRNQLGRPDHYLLHTVVAVLSYLMFGLLSPVIYGFSFRESDNKNYKLATLAAASLVCITVLSTGKAYVRRPAERYIKTIFYYLSMGFMVSGIGYVSGNLINMLLKKIGVFDSTAPVTMPGLEAVGVKGAWSSY